MLDALTACSLLLTSSGPICVVYHSGAHPHDPQAAASVQRTHITSQTVTWQPEAPLSATQSIQLIDETLWQTDAICHSAAIAVRRLVETSAAVSFFLCWLR